MAYIKALSYYLPDPILSNEDLVKEFPGWSVEKIATKISVNQRHIVNKEETSVDLAIKAAENLFKEYDNINKNEIDFIVLCTQSPDYFLPTSACIIQNKLDLQVFCGAFDFNLGCSVTFMDLQLQKV